MEKELIYIKLLEYVRNNLKNVDWDRADLYISFGIGNSCGADLKYFYQNEEFEKPLRVTEYGSLLMEIFHDYLYEGKERDFNKVILTITKDNYEVTYELDKEKIKNEKQSSALLFSNYIYERMRTQIHEFEVENKLKTPIYNDRGELYDYEESWDNGLFTFVVDVHNQTIQHTILLVKDDVERIVPLALEAFVKEAIFYHHQVTHGELKEFWKPWNKMVVTAPEQFIPLGKDQEYIEYSLVDLTEVA